MIPVFQQAFLKGGETQFQGFLHVFIAKGRGEKQHFQQYFVYMLAAISKFSSISGFAGT
jgi:hypothetical protein